MILRTERTKEAMSKLDCGLIYEQYRNKVYGYVLSKLHNHTEAEDITQTVFLKICGNIEKYDSNKASLSTWIYTITRNTVYDKLNEDRKHPAPCLLEEDIASNEEIDESILAEETLKELACALEKLPQDQRDAIVLLYYDELDRKTVAEALGITYGRLRYLHDKAIKRLEELLR